MGSISKFEPKKEIDIHKGLNVINFFEVLENSFHNINNIKYSRSAIKRLLYYLILNYGSF